MTNARMRVPKEYLFSLGQKYKLARNYQYLFRISYLDQLRLELAREYLLIYLESYTYIDIEIINVNISKQQFKFEAHSYSCSGLFSCSYSYLLMLMLILILILRLYRYSYSYSQALILILILMPEHRFMANSRSFLLKLKSKLNER